MKFIITLSVILFALNSWVLDIIVKNDKSELNDKVLKIDNGKIKYKKPEYLDGPTYNITVAEVFMISYKNGKRETFGETAFFNLQTVKKETVIVPNEKVSGTSSEITVEPKKAEHSKKKIQ